VLDLAQSRLTANSPYLSSSENKASISPLEIVERTYSMLEIEEAQKEGRLVEAFTSGTAVCVSPFVLFLLSFSSLSLPRVSPFPIHRHKKKRRRKGS
jgi:branched-chain amino acid aminotransferase